MTDEMSVRIERLIDALPEAVFAAWTTREAMEVWYRDRPDDVVRVVALDVRVGRRYRIEFGPPDAKPYVETGQYLEIDAPRRLVVSETMTGPDGPAWTDTTVTITLDEHGGKTRLVLVHEGFPSVEHREGAAGGWPGFIDRVERYLAGR